MRTHRALRVVSCALVLAALGWGCARSRGEFGSQPGSVAGGAAGGAGAADGNGGQFGLASTAGAGGVDPGDICGKSVAEVTRDPIDVVVVLDRSQSMAGKWAKTIDALVGFVKDEKSAGIRVGVNIFPAAGSLTECDPNVYASLALPMGELPDYAPTLVSGINAWTVGGETPTWGALSGTYTFAKAHTALAPERETVVVFASDGDPCCGACLKEDTAAIASLAQDAQVAGIKTYVVAIEGSSVSALDKIAAAGGTGAALDITADVSLFADKLELIRHAALGCEYDIPDPPEGERLNSDEVNVTYTPGAGGKKQTFARAADAEACDASMAWYYDDPEAPSQIVLCPSTCEFVAQDLSATVEVLFGCATVVK